MQSFAVHSSEMNSKGRIWTVLALAAAGVLCANGAEPGMRGGFALMGGGADQDAAFAWMCDRAGSGVFLILRASGTDAYDAYVHGLCARMLGVETLIIASRQQADDPAIATKIRDAGAVFVAGGSQDRYVNYWRGTPVEQAINGVISKNVPVGGTSAGLAVLGEYVFSARNDTIQSSEALKNPFDSRVTIDSDFLRVPHLEGKITDSHFVARNRMGRLIVFLARIAQSGSSAPFGIGIDEKTAVLMETNGKATVVGQGAAYFLHGSNPPEDCRPNTPLTYEHISVYRLAPGAGEFDISSWKGSGGTAYTISAKSGVLTSTLAGGGLY